MNHALKTNKIIGITERGFMFTIEVYTLGELLPVVFALDKEDYDSAMQQIDGNDFKFLVVGEYIFNKRHITKMKVGAKVDIL